MTEVVTFIKRTATTDDYGDPVVTEERRPVFCREASIGQKEFYPAQAVGLQPEIKLVLSDFWDYEGEQLLRYTPIGQTEEQLFRVLRTFRDGQELELVCYREVNPA